MNIYFADFMDFVRYLSTKFSLLYFDYESIGLLHF